MNNIGRKFFVRVKVASYVSKKLWRRKPFKSSIKYKTKKKSSVRKYQQKLIERSLVISIFIENIRS